MTRRRLLLAAAVTTAAACAPAQSGPGARPFDDLPGLYARPDRNEWPEELRRLPPEVQEMYRYAVANREVLRWMPCTCGCVNGGHASNFDCYVRDVLPDGRVRLDTMSFGWDICTGITRDVIGMREEGMTLRAIRTAVDAKWGDRGPSTKTPLPPA